MKYWRLYNSAEKEVGFVPQIVQPVFEGYYTDENQLWNTYLKKIDESTIIPKGHLYKSAKLTDLMSVSFANAQLFLTYKLREIIEQFQTVGVQFADTEIITKKGEIVKVNIMHPFFTDHFFVDIPQCEFRISNILGDIIYEVLRFDSFKDFRERRNALISENKMYEDTSFQKSISIAKLVFKENVDFGICAVFDVTYGAVGFYVSQLLKDEILNEKCTGVIFREVNERYP